MDAAELRSSQGFDRLEESSRAILGVFRRDGPDTANIVSDRDLSRDNNALEHAQIPPCISDTSRKVIDVLQKLTKRYRLDEISHDIDYQGASDNTIQEAILSSLRYSGSIDRYEAVAEAHPSTFEWVFDDPSMYHGAWDNFCAWLESGHGIYWMTGKPASGKSTMMKFVANHEIKIRALEKWAAGMTIVSPGFYFWSLGRGMQKSQAGLLRSLLLQIFETDWEITKAAFPDIWSHLASQDSRLLEKLCYPWYSWSISELKDQALLLH